MKGTLRTRRHFQRVYENGRKAVGTSCVVYAYSPQPEEIASVGHCAVGVVASRKVGNAVRRNRAKRFLREAYRALSARLIEPIWIVLIARSTLADPDTSSQDLLEELRQLLVRLGVLRDDADEAERGEFPC